MEKKCRDISRQIPQFVAGELPDEDSSQVSRHLEACKSCADLAGLYREMLSEGNSYEPDILYDAAWDRITRGLNGRKPSPKEDIGFLSAHKTAVLLASACAVLIAVFLLARFNRVQPAMSITEMEEVLRGFGDFDQAEGRAFHYGAHKPYRLIGNSESERLHRIAGVGTTDDKTYRIEPF